MTGHRRERGQPARKDGRNDRFWHRVQSASCGEDQVAAAFDWWRVTVMHISDPGRRAGLLHDMANRLAGDAQRLARWSPFTSEIERREDQAGIRRDEARAAREMGGACDDL